MFITCKIDAECGRVDIMLDLQAGGRNGQRIESHGLQQHKKTFSRPKMGLNLKYWCIQEY